MRAFKLTAIFLGIIIWILGFHAASFAQTSNNKINNSKVGQDMRNVQQNPGGTFDGYGKNVAQPVRGSSGPKANQGVMHNQDFHHAAAPTMKSVDHANVPSPVTTRSAAPAKAVTSGATSSAPSKVVTNASGSKSSPPPKK